MQMGKYIRFHASHRRTTWAGISSHMGMIGISLIVVIILSVALYNRLLTSIPFALPASNSADTENASFGFCHKGGGYNCVVDGDTFYYRGTKIRIADIDTPETHPARCPYEQQLGDAATQRLKDLLNNGAFSIVRIDRDTDRYGRALRIVKRNDESIGAILVNEGLARWYVGGRRSWC